MPIANLNNIIIIIKNFALCFNHLLLVEQVNSAYKADKLAHWYGRWVHFPWISMLDLCIRFRTLNRYLRVWIWIFEPPRISIIVKHSCHFLHNSHISVTDSCSNVRHPPSLGKCVKKNCVTSNPNLHKSLGK